MKLCFLNTLADDAAWAKIPSSSYIVELAACVNYVKVFLRISYFLVVRLYSSWYLYRETYVVHESLVKIP